MILGRAIVIFLLGLSWPGLAHAASLFFSPATGSYTPGQTFTVAIKLDPAGQAVNTVEGLVTFPVSSLEFISASRVGSVFSLWPNSPTGSNTTGQVTFLAGAPSPGHSGDDALIMNVTFAVRTAGTAQLRLVDGKILANDGQGTNLLTDQGTATLALTSVVAPQNLPTTLPSATVPTLHSTTQPDQNSWYRELPVSITHSQPPGLLGVSYSITDRLNSELDEIQESVDGSINLTLADEGIWYFHLQGRYASGWSQLAHYRLQIDRSPPEPFTLRLHRDRGQDDPTPVIEFETTDTLSGLMEYQFALNDGDSHLVQSPWTFTLNRRGQQRVTVTAVDRAGNAQASQLEFEYHAYPPPILTEVAKHLILLDDLVVRGTAVAGDVVTLLLDGQPIGHAEAGPADTSGQSGVIVRVPWAFRSDRLLRPKSYQLTAIATSSDGQVSLATDPITVRVIGNTVVFGGKQLVTLAIVPSLASGLILIIFVNVAIFIRLYFSLRRLHRRDVIVDQALHDLQQRVHTQRLTAEQIEGGLEQIERDLEGQPPRVRRLRKRT